MTHAEQTIADLEKRLKELEVEEQRLKTAINCLCEVMDKPHRYEETSQKAKKSTRTRPDEYYGRPQATVITEVLEKRKAAGFGATNLDELYDELTAGGCKFTGKNEGIKKRGLAISMSKNPKFHKLPNNTWGLKSWYPGAKAGKEARDNNLEEQAEEIKKEVKGLMDGMK